MRGLRLTSFALGFALVPGFVALGCTDDNDVPAVPIVPVGPADQRTCTSSAITWKTIRGRR